MSTTRYILTVPVAFETNGASQTAYRRVGAVFENAKKDTGETFLSIRLDFPVAVTELVAFQLKDPKLVEGEGGER